MLTCKAELLSGIYAIRAKLRAQLPPVVFARTPGQKALARKHGTPRQFASAVINAVGEISIDEAEAAIAQYLAEWRAA